LLSCSIDDLIAPPIEVNNMKTLVLAVAIVVSFFAATPTKAQCGMTGNDLQEKCREQSKERSDNWFEAGACDGYIVGVIEAQGFWSYVGDASRIRPKPYFCMPDGVTNGQSIKVVIKYLDNYPEQLHESAVLIVMESMHEAFPCPVEKSSSK
jgi:hypothetical protein